MAIADTSTEPKIRQLLTYIKWASEKATDGATVHEQKRKRYLPSPESIDEVAKSCSVKGNGLIMGLVGKRCKFYIYTDPHDMLDLHIEVKGPQGEICSEKIMSLFPTRKMSQILSEPQGGNKHPSDTDVKLVDDGHGHAFFRQKSVETAYDDENKKIPFDYQSLSKGKYVVSYVPRSAGVHTISVISYGSHISGSPFKAKIAETVGHLERQFSKDKKIEAFTKRGSGSMDYGRSFDYGDKDAGGEAPYVGDAEYTHHYNGTNAPPARLSKQGTVTRRRVLKRVVTRGGSEITLGESFQPSQGYRPRTSSYASYGSSGNSFGKPKKKQPEVLEVLDKLKKNMANKAVSSAQHNPTVNNTTTNLTNIVEVKPNVDSQLQPESVKKIGAQNPQRDEANSSESDTKITNINTSNNKAPKTEFDSVPKNGSSVREIHKDSGFEGKMPVTATENLAQAVVDSAMQSAYESLHRRQYTRQQCVDLPEGSSPENVENDSTIELSSSKGTANIDAVDASNVNKTTICEKSSAAGVIKEENQRHVVGNDVNKIGTHPKRLSAEQRSYSLTLPTIDTDIERYPHAGEDHKPIRQISSSTKSPPDSPSLKLLQSESLQKVCYYISQRAFTHSIPSLQSQQSDGNFCNVNTQVDQEEPNDKRPLLTKGNSVSISVDGQVIDIIPDCAALGSRENGHHAEPAPESKLQPSDRSTTRARRGSLVRQDVVAALQKVSEESTGSDKLSQKSDRERNDTIHLTKNEDKSHVATDSQTEQFMARNSMDVSGTSLNKSDTQSSNSLDNETTLINGLTLDEKFCTNQRKGGNTIAVSSREDSNDGMNTIVDISSKDNKTPTWYSSQVFIRIPTAKIDKWTQISYDEIKRETGWVSPRDTLRQRKVYRFSTKVELKVDPDSSSHDASARESTGDRNGPRSPLSVWCGDNLPQIVYESPEASERDALGDSEQHFQGHYDVHQWLQDNRNEMYELQPVRQSTVETVDSGIAESRCSSPGRFWRRHRHSVPNPNGHRPVCRNPYQGQIELDPRLLRSASNSPSGDDEKENRYPPRGRGHEGSSSKHLTTGHGRVGRTSSEGRRQRRSSLAREDSCSLSDTELNKSTKGQNRRTSGRSAKSSKPSPKEEATHQKSNKLDTDKESKAETEMSASESRKLKFRRRSFAVVDSDSQASAESDDAGSHTKDSSPLLTSADELSCLPSPRGFNADTGKHPDGFDKSSRRRSYGGTPSIRRRELQMQRSSTLNEDTYFGFGLSRSNRDELLHQVNSFSNLYEKHRSSSMEDSKDYRKSESFLDSSLDQNSTTPECLNPMEESLFDLEGLESLDGLSAKSHPAGANDLDDYKSHFNDFTSKRKNGSVSEDNCNESNPIRELFDMLVGHQEELHSVQEDGDLGLDPIEYTENIYTSPEQCRAIGPGLETGTVGTRLFFQVITEGAGNGYLTVGIKGQCVDHVGEVSVTYSGDYRYEVSYEVTFPGYYAIYVKWSDESIPNSPFISRITF